MPPFLLLSMAHVASYFVLMTKTHIEAQQNRLRAILCG